MTESVATNSLDQGLLSEARSLAARIEAQAEQAERLRTFADRIDEQTSRDRSLLEELEGLLGTSLQLCIDQLDQRIRGQHLEEVAVKLLEEEIGRGEEIHYRLWFDLLLKRGIKVAGKKPIDTFLAQINRPTKSSRSVVARVAIGCG